MREMTNNGLAEKAAETVADRSLKRNLSGDNDTKARRLVTASRIDNQAK